MSMFDFLFPAQAQAAHLRSIANHHQQLAYQNHHAAVQNEQNAAHTDARLFDLEERVWKLESDLGFVSLLCGSLLNILETKLQCSRQELFDIMRELDKSDGFLDGKLNLASLRNLSQDARAKM